MNNISESLTLKNTMRKNPHLYKHFISISSSFENKAFKDSDIISLFYKIKKYHLLLKSKKIDLLKFKSFEKIEDKINELIQFNEAEKLLKSLISKKYKHLVNNKTKSLFFDLLHNSIERQDISGYINKIAAFTDSDELNNALQVCLFTKTNNSINSILDVIKKENLNVDISYVSHYEKLLILKINDYKASKKLGSSSWCISYNERYFNMYINKKNKFQINSNQFFIFDFSSKQEQYSMIGATISFNSLIFAADKRDKKISLFETEETPYNIKKAIKLIEKTIDINMIKYHNKNKIITQKLNSIKGNDSKTLSYLEFVIKQFYDNDLSFNEENIVLLSHVIERFKQKGLYKKSFNIFSKVLLKEIKNGFEPNQDLVDTISSRNKGFAFKLAHIGLKVEDKYIQQIISKKNELV